MWFIIQPECKKNFFPNHSTYFFVIVRLQQFYKFKNGEIDFEDILNRNEIKTKDYYLNSFYRS